MWNMKQTRRKNVLIVGGFRKARNLALSLLRRGMRVTLINQSYEDCRSLAEIKGCRVIYGDGTKKYILEQAQAQNCQIVIALLEEDETNFVICQMCKEFFQVPKCVALLGDPEKTPFFYQMGVDRVVCALNMITNVMEEQAMEEEMMNLVHLEEGRIHVGELPVLKASALAEKRLWECNLPKEIIVGCILRGDTSIVPRGDTKIKEGDILIVITSDQSKLKELAL